MLPSRRLVNERSHSSAHVCIYDVVTSFTLYVASFNSDHRLEHQCIYRPHCVSLQHSYTNLIKQTNSVSQHLDCISTPGQRATTQHHLRRASPSSDLYNDISQQSSNRHRRRISNDNFQHLIKNTTPQVQIPTKQETLQLGSSERGTESR